MVDFLTENGGWIFGSGGFVALILALVRQFRQSKETKTLSSSGDGNIVGNHNTTTNMRGVGALELGIVVALIVGAIGLAFYFLGGDCNSTSNGDHNQTTIVCK